MAVYRREELRQPPGHDRVYPPECFEDSHFDISMYIKIEGDWLYLFTFAQSKASYTRKTDNSNNGHK